MTVCYQCHGAGAHQGVGSPIKDDKGNSVHKPTGNATGTASSSCSACGGTGILRSFGV